MAIQYNLTAIELLQTLGYTKRTGQPELENFEKEQSIQLPAALSEFMSLRADIDLMSTSDIWQIPYFSYIDIEERIEEDAEYWEENPDDCEGDEFYEFSQIPKEQWPERVSNYLQIGSDYAAGVVNFGIDIRDLSQDNPPVYLLNEDNSICDWEPLYDTLTEFLLCIMGDVLCCQDYHTAPKALEQNGWNYEATEYPNTEQAAKALQQHSIDFSALESVHAYGRDISYSCCYDSECHTLYWFLTEPSLCKVYKISKNQ
ncbi:MAG: SMI1/KNR4 family protein [Lachnospiraceae bacterium]|nr:SMI1/KNR4 family protein [Lachnospiraceae bacterium]